MKWLDKIVLRVFSSELTLLQDEDKYLLKEIQSLRKRVTGLEKEHCYTATELEAQSKINNLFTDAVKINRETIEAIHNWNTCLVEGLKDKNLL